MDFAFDPKTQRFRYTSGIFAGKFVSRADVQEIIENGIKRLKTDIKTVTELLLNNKISVSTWESTMAEIIKKGDTQSYLAGKGGKYIFKSRDKGIVGKALAEEYAYLRRFSQEIKNGNLSSSQIKDRANKYGDSFYKFYERGRAESHKEAGFRWEKWIIGAYNNVCPDCIAYSLSGWQLIGHFPSIGVATACKMRCRCHKDYSSNVSKPDLNLLNSRQGWINHAANYGTYKVR
jgi:hypothetical protein